jgi:hypothetical protein
LSGAACTGGYVGNITIIFAPATGGENQIKCAAFIDGSVFNFANQYGTAQKKPEASR